MFVTSGRISEFVSALKDILSRSLLPILTVPSQVMLPVACKFPLTSTLVVVKTNRPVPSGSNVIFELSVVLLILLVVMSRDAVVSRGTLTVGFSD